MILIIATLCDTLLSKVGLSRPKTVKSATTGDSYNSSSSSIKKTKAIKKTKVQKPVVETVSVVTESMSHQQKLQNQQEDATELQSACVHEPSVCQYSATPGGATPGRVTSQLQPPPPVKRSLPPPPTGKVTQEQGEAYCCLICDTYPGVFDGGKGNFCGAEATMHIKPGHMEQLQKLGVRPPAKILYGLDQEEYNRLLGELYEDYVPIDGMSS